MIVERIKLLPQQDHPIRVRLGVVATVSRTGLYGEHQLRLMTGPKERAADYRSNENVWCYLGLYMVVRV